MAWYNVFKRSGEVEKAVADEYDSLAVIVRFASIKERSFAFYQKHRQFVDAALEFVGALRAESRNLGLMLSGSGDSIAKIAQSLRTRVGDLGLSHKAQELIDSDTRELVSHFAPMLADTSRPAYLEECRWVVEGASEKPVASETSEAGF